MRIKFQENCLAESAICLEDFFTDHSLACFDKG
jgi:hypothetical protein